MHKQTTSERIAELEAMLATLLSELSQARTIADVALAAGGALEDQQLATR